MSTLIKYVLNMLNHSDIHNLLELRRAGGPTRELRVRLRDREHQVAEEERAAQGHRA